MNYTMSEAVERMALTPKSPTTADERAIPEKYRPDWIRSAQEPVPILFHTTIDEAGNPVPAPVRGNDAPDLSWVGPMLETLNAAAKDTTGIFDVALGNVDAGAESGVALKTKTANSDRGQLVYTEHLQIAVKRIGYLMLDLFPGVLEPAGVLPTQQEDGTTTVYQVGEPAGEMIGPDGMPLEQQPGQMPMLSDLNPQDLDISISSGPAYSTRKEDGLNNLAKVLQLAPDSVAKVEDLIVKAMDFPGSEAIADRLYKALPPELKTGEPGAPGAMDPAMQQAMQQTQAQMADLQGQLAQAQQQNQMLQFQVQNNAQLELQKAQLKAQSDFAIAQMKANMEFAIAQMKEAGADARKQQDIMAEVQKWNAELMLKITENRADAMGGTMVAPPPGAVLAPPAQQGTDKSLMGASQVP
jgi:hypothetical protein